ncbi:aspartyl/asparaginyl beta-hydroxylase domain-containing protein [Chromatocurvus halotolerans]|uniref:Tetratricopeptide repeat protein n=1 Tax=Chromatocurvus halotolerans TaxID=1132028 RepID=A0A4V2SC99_9GAMM|nr:aspartyl/asparaginyl beta-hydroxylase domain-containing protein [Chromatocurvus halotolerans]TCO78500.1 tetratricopeptide repeat protein [Chromatocurvus halotolerans]
MNEQNSLKTTLQEAQSRVRRGDARSALELLQAAMPVHGESVDLHMNVAIAQRALGNYPAAIESLNAVLAIDPYTFMALLSKGSILEQIGHLRQAAEVYRNALRIAPPDAKLPAGLAAPMQQARAVIAQQSEAMAAHFRDALGPVMESHEGESLGRFEECLDIVAGTKKVYNAEPVQLHVPQLPAIPFFERSHFPWLETLEAATDTIRGELDSLLKAGLPGFEPYVQYAPGTPENQFKALNHAREWSSLWLWKDGEAQSESMARCPKTAALLEQLPLADQPGFAPTALFSALAPHTHIPPHTGSTNARLLVHLPLVLPGPARFRVGNQQREWRLGEAWVFDDTIEHEAWNDADETRVILIFDIWNPLLSAAERELISALLVTHRDWLQG